jgi:hypothetical protein
VLSSPVFVYTELRSAYTACPGLRGELRSVYTELGSANPHFRSVPSPPLPRALAPRAGSYDTNYLRSPHPRRAFCGSRAVGGSGPAGETLLRGFTFNFELSTLDLVTFRPSCGFCELCIKNSPPLRPNRPTPPKIAPQNIATRPLQTASQRPPLHQSANSRHLFSTPCALFCNFLHFFALLPHPRPFVFNHLRTLLLFSRGGGRVPAPQGMSSRAKRGICFFFTSLPHYSITSISIKINTSKPTSRFTVFWPNSSARNPFGIRTSTIRVRKLFRIRAYKKHGGGGAGCRIS